ncbi:beta-N-acetylhexosaminidase [Siphonobacter sp. BAB-5404]|nr:beta-N-acetylhexosaminidase [Siphonobacter sp. SORGH_AS_0500]
MIRMLKNKLVFLGMCGLLALTAWKSPIDTSSFSEVMLADSTHEVRSNADVTKVSAAQLWVDSTLAGMNLDEKIGQFFVIGTYSNRYESYYASIDRLIKAYHIGGVIFFQGDPYSQAELSNRYQNLSKVPLLVSLDAENGLGMRLALGTSFPHQMTLGAIQDNNLIYDMGMEIGRQCKRIGVQMNFAPVVDVNSNPLNPIIGYRSFGEDPNNVAEKGKAYARGLQAAGVLACAKHFPGHGDTQTDSHRTLPKVGHDQTRLNQFELPPFKALIDDGVASILVAHLEVPAYESRPIASTLSAPIVTDLLKNQLKFNGLVVTDAMNMRGVTKGKPAPDANLQALLAGNDLLLQPESVGASIVKIKQAITSGQITEDEINRRVQKILYAKYNAGLVPFQTIPVDKNLVKELKTPQSEALRERLYENAITLVKNDRKLVPLVQLDTLKISAVAVGESENNVFQNTLRKYANVKCYTNGTKTDERFYAEMLSKLDSSEVVIVSLHEMRQKVTQNYGVSWASVDFVKKLVKRGNQVIVCAFGNPYSLKNFPEVPTLLCGYEGDPFAQKATAEVVFGALPALGKLPVSVEGLFPVGHGLTTQAIGRLTYGLPEEVGMNSGKLQTIDNIMNESIRKGAFPGGQVVIARKGRVVWEKNYGKLTYALTPFEPVRDTTLYDLASVTKVAATLQALMLLNENGDLDLNQKLSYYLPDLKGTTKENLIVRDVLMHQSGLLAYLPFWEKTKPEGIFSPDFDLRVDTLNYTLMVARDLWTKPATIDSVWKWVVQSPMTTQRDRSGRYKYIYSDLGLIMLRRLVEKISNQPLDAFVQQNFYEPLGMYNTLFSPLMHGVIDWKIAPTEDDRVFRETLLRGTVHDQNAAIQGGVSGHAGLFSTANDLAILMQMNLQNGYYGGRRYFLPNTVPMFSYNYTLRSYRGLGWDRNPDGNGNAYISSYASNRSFGHSGFTGTLVWADPAQELVVIFLSNRVHPNANNNLITSLRIRRRIMDAAYEAIEKTTLSQK